MALLVIPGCSVRVSGRVVLSAPPNLASFLIFYMSAGPAESGLLLGYGRRVPFLCYADDVRLLSDDSRGLQNLIDSMQGFCISVNLVISVAKPKVLVFHGADI